MATNLLDLDNTLAALRAVAEPTRLRIVALLAAGELTVKDLTRVLGQSQPRISRHLRLLHDAGLLARFQEGSWVYFRLTDEPVRRGLLDGIFESVDRTSEAFDRDRARAEDVRRERFEHAQAFFASNAAEWDRLRLLHVDEGEVERRLLAALPAAPCDLLVDMGTGTGRMLELLAGRYERAIGVDTSQHMLAYARARAQGPAFRNAQIRQGDICNLALPGACAGLVVMHQVLHYLADPDRAIAEAARILAPDGLAVIVDFAPHTLEHLRDEFAHQRLGFAESQMASWCRKSGLEIVRHELLPPAGAAVGEAPDYDSGKSQGDAGNGLTVSIWLARHRPATGLKAARNKVLETIG